MGKKYPVSVSLDKVELSVVDAYAKKHSINRSEALRRLISVGLNSEKLTGNILSLRNQYMHQESEEKFALLEKLDSLMVSQHLMMQFFKLISTRVRELDPSNTDFQLDSRSILQKMQNNIESAVDIQSRDEYFLKLYENLEKAVLEYVEKDEN